MVDQVCQADGTILRLLPILAERSREVNRPALSPHSTNVKHSIFFLHDCGNYGKLTRLFAVRLRKIHGISTSSILVALEPIIERRRERLRRNTVFIVLCTNRAPSASGLYIRQEAEAGVRKYQEIILRARTHAVAKSRNTLVMKEQEKETLPYRTLSSLIHPCPISPGS